MKVLLDECIPRKLKRLLPQHEVKTVPEVGMAGLRNGVLLKKTSEAGFEVFVTIDRNLAFQQDIKNLPVAVVVLHAKSNKLKDLESLVIALAGLLASPLERRTYHVGA
jgi:hypothetical protein